MAIKTLTKKQKEKILRSKSFRKAFYSNSFFHFLQKYLRATFELKPSKKHIEIIQSLESFDEVNEFLTIIGFRGCAKTTLIEAYALWCMINGKYNFIVYIGNTSDDAKESLANIRNEIEENEELRRDFDIHIEHVKKQGFKEKWTEGQLTIRDCTIIARGRMQKVRGRKYKKHRIDLILCDDIEDVEGAKTKEKRLRNREWFFSEVLPATKQGVGSEKVKVVVIGNKVHKECLVVHLSKNEKVKHIEFPVIDEYGEITWQGKYPNMEAIEKEKNKVMLAGEGLGHIIWAREYLLKDVDPEDAVITRADFQFYPDEWLQKQPISAGVAVDFAISERETADYTAFTKGIEILNDDGERRLLIMKNNFHGRINFEKTIEKAMEINNIMPHGTKFYPEDVGYQRSAIEIMKKNGLLTYPQKSTKEKRARIASACYFIKTGRVLFPKEGAEEIIENLVGFGVETHDDVADSCAMLILAMAKTGTRTLLA